MKPSIVIIFCLFLVQKTYSKNQHLTYSNFLSDTISLSCEDVVPYYEVDLQDHPDSLWILKGSDVVKRDGYCCMSAETDSTAQCISFNVFLDKNAVGLVMDVKNPAPANDAYFRVNCGSNIKLGEFICLNGGKSYTLTFCNPGEDRPDYIIQSIAGAKATDSITVNADTQCKGYLNVSGLESSTISWSVKYPAGADSLLNYLDLSDIENPVFNPNAETPSLIIFEVCGSVDGLTCDSFPVMNCKDIVVHYDGCNSLIMNGVNLNFDKANTLLVYPNPGKGMFTVEAKKDNTESSLLEVYNAIGILILKKELKNSSGMIKETLDLGNITNGVYFIRLKDANRILTKKIIVEKTFN